MKKYTREELMQIAARIDELVFGEQEDPPRYKLRWEAHPYFPVSAFEPEREAMIKWFEAELAALPEHDEQRGMYLDMIEGPITSPIVLLPVGPTLHVIDGPKRLAASMLAERKSCPAFILRLEPVMQMAPAPEEEEDEPVSPRPSVATMSL